MPRVYLPLLPIPALAILLAVSCSRPRSDEPASRVIPPAAPLVEPARVEPAPPLEHAARDAAAAPSPAPEEPPTAEEVRAFERPVAK